MKLIAMIPARMGSQRLARKNLAEIAGAPMIAHAVRKCLAVGAFDEIWINSEHPDFGLVAQSEGVRFHQRPEALGDNNATSEQFVTEFLLAHPCDWLVQVHSIAPLLTVDDLRGFTDEVRASPADAVFSVVDEQLECLFEDQPVNFTFERKTNSQELTPVRRIVWAVTAWRSKTFLDAVAEGLCATYAGKRAFVSVDRMAGLVVKTRADLDLAAALFPA